MKVKANNCVKCKGFGCRCGSRCQECQDHNAGLHNAEFSDRVTAKYKIRDRQSVLAAITPPPTEWRQKVEAKYALLEKAKEILKIFVKKSISALIAMGVMLSAASAHGKTFDKKTFDDFIKLSNQTAKGEVKVDGQLKELKDGQFHMTVRYLDKDGKTGAKVEWLNTSDFKNVDCKTFGENTGTAAQQIGQHLCDNVKEKVTNDFGK